MSLAQHALSKENRESPSPAQAEDGKNKTSNSAVTPSKEVVQAPAPKETSNGTAKPDIWIGRLILINCDELGKVRLAIEQEAYYHGFMTRQESEELLNKHGQFLVRKIETDGGGAVLVLSTFHEDKHHHFLFKRTEQQRLYWIYKFAFKWPNDLVQFHYRNRESISIDGLKLGKPFFKQDWQLNHEQVERKDKLGQGSFGEVYEGLLQTSAFMPRIQVAIKTLHSRTSTSMNGDEKFQFLKEANLMLPLKHENVIKIYGVCTAREPVQIIMELAVGGSLLSKLCSQVNAPTMNDKLNFAFGAAKGMGYLEEKSIIHRDLAARNCLLSKTNQVKISDFGLSILGHEYRDKKLKNVPTRWMAPESLKRGKYSSKSDVYSYSVLLYEIYTDGAEPYEGIDNKYIKKLVLEQKIHLQIAADKIPDEIESLRKLCGDYNSEERPTFQKIVSIVAEMIPPPPPSIWDTMKGKLRALTTRQE